MAPTLQELVDHNLLTQAEALELNSYLTSDPLTYWLAPQTLRDKAWMSLPLMREIVRLKAAAAAKAAAGKSLEHPVP